MHMDRLREFCGVHVGNMNGTKCRDGVKVWWCLLVESPVIGKDYT